MWSFTPPQQIPHDLDVTPADAKSRAHLDAGYDAEERRRRRQQRRREPSGTQLDVDTFEHTSEDGTENNQMAPIHPVT